MSSIDVDFLASALCEHGSATTLDEFSRWFESRRRAQRITVKKIPFRGLRGWAFDSSTGNLVHETGRFFSIEGAWVETNQGFTPQWSQPIINQPEIGILGILAKRIDGVLHFLMQAKTEPGNLGEVQLAPTLQATRSNFTRAHKGRQPPYLEFFTEHGRHRPLVDVLQSEQGARFLRKRNRNIILEVEGEVPMLEDFIWLTLGQIHRLLQLDNTVNMCTRTVLANIGFGNRSARPWSPVQLMERALIRVGGNGSLQPPRRHSFPARVLESELETGGARHSNEEVVAWFTELKFRRELRVERIPLKYVQDWVRGEDTIFHREHKFFSVLGVHFEAQSREVTSWDQPIIQQRQEGIVAFLVKEINGVLHFLVQGKVEVGNFDVVEIAPTIQCVTGSYRDRTKSECPPFLDEVLSAPPERIHFQTRQSEEGGRFFHEQNLSLVVEVDPSFPEDLPSNFIWVTLRQLKELIRYNNFVNAQARCLLSCIGLVDKALQTKVAISPAPAPEPAFVAA